MKDDVNQQPYQGYPPQPYPQQGYPAAMNPYAEARSFAPPPPPPPQIDTQYQSHAPPTFTPAAPFPTPAPQAPQPQFATFDAHKRPVNDDALPAMPSWNDARSVQVQVEEEAVPEKRGDVEMDRLNYNGSVPNSSTGGVAAAALGAGRSPVSPLHNTDAHDNQYARQASPAQHQTISPIYGANDAYAQQNYRQPSPTQSFSQYSQSSAPQDPYAYSYDDRRSPAPAQPYTIPQNPYNSPPAQNPYNPPSERYNSPAPPSYHTTAPQPSYAPAPYPAYNQPRSNTPGYSPVNAAGGGIGYDAVPSRSQTPSAYPGQQTYQAFQPQGGQYSGVVRKPVEGSARDV
ncbi:hypothetical protein N0V94_006948 [Neodidymelliopsis sp. IMI 364377]|nr:hypothetical protein N0V94_006948 [Neodidymelliopsis sp. IMI 364377]